MRVARTLRPTTPARLRSARRRPIRPPQSGPAPPGPGRPAGPPARRKKARSRRGQRLWPETRSRSVDHAPSIARPLGCAGRPSGPSEPSQVQRGHHISVHVDSRPPRRPSPRRSRMGFEGLAASTSELVSRPCGSQESGRRPDTMCPVPVLVDPGLRDAHRGLNDRQRLLLQRLYATAEGLGVDHYGDRGDQRRRQLQVRRPLRPGLPDVADRPLRLRSAPCPRVRRPA